MSSRTSTLRLPQEVPGRRSTGIGQRRGGRPRVPNGTAARRSSPAQAGSGIRAVPRLPLSGRRPDDLFRVPYEIELDPGFNEGGDIADDVVGLPFGVRRFSAGRGGGGFDPAAD